ncbi:MAG: hypothetical protein JWR19_1112 [Pedosphaera sp.]|nr:hypothetical protein [Pedosphaera sp.]
MGSTIRLRQGFDGQARTRTNGHDEKVGSEDFGGAFFEHADVVAEAVGGGEFAEPAGGFVHVFEGKTEGAIMHGNKPFGADVLEDFDGFVGAHVDVAEGFGAVGADGEHGDVGREVLADLFEAFEVGAVAGVIDDAALVFEDEAAVAAVVVAEDAGAPVFARGEGDFPIAMGKAFPPVEFDDAFEAEVAGEVAHAPGHDADFGVGQFAEGRFVKVIEMGVGEEDEIDGGQVLDFKAGTFDAFEEEKPVGEIGVDEDVEVGELDEEGGVANPGEGDFAFGEFGELGALVLAGARGQESLPDHFMKKSAGIEGFGGGEVLERAGHLASRAGRPGWFGGMLGHKFLIMRWIR